MGKVDLVGAVQAGGQRQHRPARLEALGMGVDEVIAGLQSENVNTPLGRLNRGGTECPLRISGKPEAVDEFKTMVIGQRSGPARSRWRRWPRSGTASRSSGRWPWSTAIPAVALDILKQSGANTVAVVDAVKKEIDRAPAGASAGDRRSRWSGTARSSSAIRSATCRRP